MRQKRSSLDKNDPVVQKFEVGSRSYEKPLDTPTAATSRSNIKIRESIPTSGTAKKPRVRQQPEAAIFKLSEADPTLHQFKAGQERSEKAFKKIK